MDATISRKMWRTLEPYHGMIYFVPEAAQAYQKVGLDLETHPRMGYFASRGAAMGAVSAEMIIATFFNFNPTLVRRVIPAAWKLAEPEKILAARLEAVDAALRRSLGDALESAEIAEAAKLAQEAANVCKAYPEGRPLFAAHAALPWSDIPHLVLWQAQTLLREFRGDGHIAAMTVEGVNGCEALVIHAATGAVPAKALQASRAWPDEDWAAACARLVRRGWLNEDGSFTEAGKNHRDWVELRTDQLAFAPWEHLGEEGCQRLRELVRPLSKKLVEIGTFPARLAILED